MEQMNLWDLNLKYGNGDYSTNPKIKTVRLYGQPMTWQEWEKWCGNQIAEKIVKVLFILELKELNVMA